ncbi:hypothetical protein P4O66_004450 [Electrophorus voltai]|uniref:protein-tyrosine-phosphatase n=1 Tax=Electrophorus voltai TaxID=2609070 RepID=A0AAD8ZMI5_9TELE|nr:hypothetical protein P4O66_004450 [Electrophorus voltai]
MDPAKVWAVESWPKPALVHLVQCFLGFMNFYRRFVKNFSTVAASLTTLTRKASGRFCWSTEAQQVFEELKHHLITAPILRLPDAELLFIIEVDASEVAERNYDVGDRKLLAVKLALQVETLSGGGKTPLPVGILTTFCSDLNRYPKGPHHGTNPVGVEKAARQALMAEPDPAEAHQDGCMFLRRGSNVSLTLDMCTPGTTEPYGALLSPREQSTQEYLERASNILSPAQLHTRALNDAALQAEFYETPMNFVDPKEYNIPGVVRKNRYKTILPNTHSRVCLQAAEEDDFLSTYINANYLKGYGGQEKVYIATQGPTVNTVGDFWRMIWQEHCPIIVMITNIEEKNEYEGEVRCLRHYWYTSWPDQKTPDKAPPLLQLVQEVEEARKQALAHSGPVIVHCSAGIGRTGCFIATTILCEQLRCEGVVDILRTTCQLRLDRGGMIQTAEQYQFVHHVLSLYERQLNQRSEE